MPDQGGAAEEASAPFGSCIVGAGAAGPNALVAASRSLRPSGRIALIDRRASPGGRWNEAYDDVRLHRAHSMFTAGNIPRRIDRPPHDLATGPEVLAHRTHRLATLERSVSVTRPLGRAYLDTAEDEGGVPVRHAGSEGTATLRADRPIVARGDGGEAPAPRALGSDAVVSTAPIGLFGPEVPQDAPVYVVGGGKTGMDTCHARPSRAPSRKVVPIAGTGVAFGIREVTTPRGPARYWRGTPISTSFRNIARAFDGTHADEVVRTVAGAYSHGLDPGARNLLFGILSRAERAFIRGGLADRIYDDLSDVEDGPDGSVMAMRSGARRRIERGAVVVHRTVHLMRETLGPAGDDVSEGGRVPRISPRSAVHVPNTVSACFLAHLWHRGALPHPDIYARDFSAVFQKDRKIARMAGVVVSYQMHCAILESPPMKVFDECGLDLNRCYPPHRRIPILIDLKRSGRRHLAQCRAALDRLPAGLGVPMRPVGQRSAASAAPSSIAPS